MKRELKDVRVVKTIYPLRKTVEWKVKLKSSTEDTPYDGGDGPVVAYAVEIFQHSRDGDRWATVGGGKGIYQTLELAKRYARSLTMTNNANKRPREVVWTADGDVEP